MTTRASVLVASLGLAGLAACGWSDASSPQRVELVIEHSAFAPQQLAFERGDIVTFVIRNDDPIDHEFILGDQTVQDRHEEGRQRHHHGTVAGEVSVPAGATRTTTFTFTEEGTLIYGCHVPGHYSYGMRGEVTVE